MSFSTDLFGSGNLGNSVTDPKLLPRTWVNSISPGMKLTRTTAVGISTAGTGWEDAVDKFGSAIFPIVINTRTTIANVTGKGYCTSIIGPSGGFATTRTKIWVTRDGVETLIDLKQDNNSAGGVNRLVLGHVIDGGASLVSTELAVNRLNGENSGFQHQVGDGIDQPVQNHSNSSQLFTPQDSILSGAIFLTFESAFKVEMEIATLGTNTAYTGKCGALYELY